MIRVRKVFSNLSSTTPYVINVRGAISVWLSEEELIELVIRAREVLPKKLQIPFSEHSMPKGGMKVMIPIV